MTQEVLDAAKRLAETREQWMTEKTDEAREAYIAANRNFRELCTLKEMAHR